MKHLSYLVLLLGLGCNSNPTPHPASEDTAAQPPATDTGAGGVNNKDDEEAVCEQAGGVWEEDICVFESAEFADATGSPGPSAPPRADVVAVTVAGDASGYTFDVTIESGDSGCDGYADWWEVLTLEGELLYRRILTHPHVDEQPFTRSGGPVEIAEDALFIVRAHFHPSGYGSEVVVGTVGGGFTRARISGSFAAALASQDPLPGECTP